MMNLNKEIEVVQIQADRIWFHSKTLGYGKWICNSELFQLIKYKSIKAKKEGSKYND